MHRLSFIKKASDFYLRKWDLGKFSKHIRPSFQRCFNVQITLFLHEQKKKETKFQTSVFSVGHFHFETFHLQSPNRKILDQQTKTINYVTFSYCIQL